MTPVQAPASSAVQFSDVTREAGIRFRHTSGRSGRLLLPETLGAGCAFLDYNGDGRLDLFLVNSGRLPGFAEPGPFYPALYRNDGEGRFTDVTKAAGLAVERYGLGVAAADYDADGDTDLYLTALGSNALYRNNGDGTFSDVTKQAGLGDPHFSTSAAWFDYNGDGRLDLFVCNYCRWSPALNQVCPDTAGRKHLCGPTFYEGEPSTLYRNNGDSTFSDVTKAAGLYETVGKALGVVVWDENDDGQPDLALAKDMEPNLLFRNTGRAFVERGVEAGIAYSKQGKTRAGMGIDTAEAANDGRESLLIGNNSGQGLAQYLAEPAEGEGRFSDAADQTGLFTPSLPFLTFGLAFVDWDCDGDRDIVTANGHVDENVDVDGIYTFAQTPLAFRNQGDGTFTPANADLGPVFAEKRVWRGLAIGDYDGDGDPDLLLTACNGAPALLRNDGGNRNAWLQVRAVGSGGSRGGIGARVTVTAGGKKQVGWTRSGGSYCSQHELAAFFGLGSVARADEVEVLFPGGARRVLRDVAARQVLVVRERPEASGPAR